MNVMLPTILLSARKLIKVLLLTIGSIFSVMIILSFTSLPFWAQYYLGISSEPLKENPEVIVVMGGGGMPSPDGLINCYYGAKAAQKYPNARIIVALPGDTTNFESSIKKMGYELILRGVDSMRIVYENQGTNTRWEALNIKKRFFPNTTPSLLIVSSPSHIYRTVRTFRKVGFKQVASLASFEQANEESLFFDAEELGGLSQIPDVGNHLSLRYKIWTRMHLQINVIREYFAIAYYWMMGWI